MDDWQASLLLKLKNTGQNDTNAIIAQFIETMQSSLVEAQEKEMHRQIEKMSQQFSNLKQDVCSVNAEVLEDNFIPKIAEELHLIVQHTEESVSQILNIFDEICELVLQASPTNIKDSLLSKSTKILEACNFQDIVNQRIKNVTTNLTSIEAILMKILNGLAIDKNTKIQDKSSDEKLLNGPTQGRAGPSQKEIDDIFNSI